MQQQCCAAWGCMCDLQKVLVFGVPAAVAANSGRKEQCESAGCATLKLPCMQHMV